MKVRLLQSCSGLGFAFSSGEIAELSPEQAQDFIRHGLAEPLQPETANAKGPKPETTRVKK